MVKKNKDSYTWQSTDWQVTEEIYEKSIELAKEFNQVHNCTISIEFAGFSVHRVINSSGTASGPKLNEYVFVEDYLPGTFTKWCNNYGYISPASDLMPAFMHWSWVHSKGQMMVADLQGVLDNTKNTYRLTDPVLLSNTESGKYGCTDMGVEGMAMFFLKHTCNQFCQALPKPTRADVPGSSTLQLQLLMTSTAYAHELKLPIQTRKTMVSVFPRVATRYAY